MVVHVCVIFKCLLAGGVILCGVVCRLVGVASYEMFKPVLREWPSNVAGYCSMKLFHCLLLGSRKALLNVTLQMLQCKMLQCKMLQTATVQNSTVQNATVPNASVQIATMQNATVQNATVQNGQIATQVERYSIQHFFVYTGISILKETKIQSPQNCYPKLWKLNYSLGWVTLLRYS